LQPKINENLDAGQQAPKEAKEREEKAFLFFILLIFMD
jgi:hypothetical protein